MTTMAMVTETPSRTIKSRIYAVNDDDKIICSIDDRRKVHRCARAIELVEPWDEYTLQYVRVSFDLVLMQARLIPGAKRIVTRIEYIPMLNHGESAIKLWPLDDAEVSDSFYTQLYRYDPVTHEKLERMIASITIRGVNREFAEMVVGARSTAQ